MSRGISVILMVLYGFVVFTRQSFFFTLAGFNLKLRFSVYTHEHFSDSYDTVSADGRVTSRSRSLRPTPRRSPSPVDVETEKGVIEVENEEEGEDRRPTMNLWVSIISLCLSAFLLLVVVFFTIQLVAGFTTEHPSFNEEYLGLIVIPFILNVSEQIPAFYESAEGKIDEVMAIALGKSGQFTLSLPLSILADVELQFRLRCSSFPLSLSSLRVWADQFRYFSTRSKTSFFS